MLINVGAGGVVDMHSGVLEFLAVALTEPVPTLLACLLACSGLMPFEGLQKVQAPAHSSFLFLSGLSF